MSLLALNANSIVIRHPLSAMLVAAAFCAGLLVVFRSFSLGIVLRHRAVAACWWLIAVVGAAFVAMAVLNGTTHLFLDHVEPNVIGISWMFATGQPVYHATDSAARYSLLYGPDLFAIYALLLKVTGENILVLKAVVAMTLAAALLVMYGAFRKVADRSISALAAGYALVAIASYADLPLWVRADAPLLLMSAMALWVALRMKGTAGAIAFGAIVGVAINIKAHTPLYFLPLWCLFAPRWKIKSLASAALTTIIVTIIPFVVFKQVSLHNYVEWLREAGKHGLRFGSVMRNGEILFFLAVPASVAAALLANRSMMTLRAWASEHVTFIISGIACSAMVVVIASKPGAGPWHLMPFLVAIGYAVASLSQRLIGTSTHGSNPN